MFFFQIISDACLQLENYDERTDMAVVREPVQAYLGGHCQSFATVSAHAVFSVIFTVKANVVMMTE